MNDHDRRPAIAGTSVTAVTAVMGIATLLLVYADLDSSPWWRIPGLSQEWTYALRLAVTFLGVFTLGIVAGLLVRRQPRSLLAWSFASGAVLNALQQLTSQYAIHGLLVAPGSLPLARAAAQLQLFIGGPLIASYILAVLTFPDGRLVSRRWRILVAAVVVALALDTLARLDAPYPIYLGPGGVQGIPVTGPPALWAIGVAFQWAGRWVFWGLFFIFGAIGLAVIQRLRASRGETRLQLKWFAYTTAIGVVVTVVARLDGIPPIARALGDASDPIHQWADLVQGMFTGVIIPMSIGVAIMRYRLYDIDVVINRTIVYGGLVAFVTLAYAAVAATAGALLGQSLGVGPVATIAAIAIIAALLEPVRRRLNDLANIAIYGKRARPYEVLSDFARSVSDAASSDVLLPRMARLVRDATRATSVEIWVRVADRMRLAASAPVAPDTHTSLASADDVALRSGPTGTVVPVFAESEQLGLLVVRKPRGEPLSTAEQRLLDDLASQAGLVFSRFRLVEELRESRARIVAAQDEERRRIERDLHDGAQQRFVNAMLSVGMAQALDGKGEDPTNLLAQASQEMQAGLVELRALARGVHPPLLTDEGLPAAIASLADRSPILTSVHIAPERRYPGAVEATAYFVVAEALANAAKHSNASSIDISIDERDGRLHVEVKDDGVGGVDPARGSGIVGLRDRAAAIGGRLDVDSDGHGTIVRAELPCG